MNSVNLCGLWLHALAVMPPRGAFTHVKRRRAVVSSSSEPAWDDGIELEDLRRVITELEEERSGLHSAFKSAGVVFDMRKPGDDRRLAEALYEGDYLESMKSLRAANAEFVTVLRAQLTNTSELTEHRAQSIERSIDGVLLDTCRGQNQNYAECDHTTSAVFTVYLYLFFCRESKNSS